MTVTARESAAQPYTLVAITGEADVTNREDLHRVLDEEVALQPGTLILDLSGLRFMDSSALHVILQANRTLDRVGGMMALVAPQDAVAKMLRLTTADRLIPVFGTVAEAAIGLPPASKRGLPPALKTGCLFSGPGDGITYDIVVPTTQARCSRHGVVAERADWVSPFHAAPGDAP